MTGLTPAEITARTGLVLAQRLRPFVEDHPPADANPRTWVEHYRALDHRNGRAPRQYTLDDPRLLLKILIQQWRHLDRRVTPLTSGYARELLETLNQVAHSPTSITVPAAARAIETCRLLMRSLDLPTEAATAALKELHHALYAPLDDGAQRPQIISHLTTGTETDTSTGMAKTPASADEPTAASEPAGAVASAERPRPAPVPTSKDDPTASLDNELDAAAALEEGQRRLVLQHRAVTLTVTSRESLNYALVTNGIGPVVDVVARNDADEPTVITDVKIWIDLGQDDAPTPFGGRAQAVAPLKVPAKTESQLTAAQLALPLQPNAFADLDEATGALLHVEATLAGERRVGEVPIRLLARDEWTGRSIPELLAAFITPNDLDLQPLITAIADYMGERTGSRALDGYQGTPERVKQMAEAIYVAIASQGITYSVEPASFELDGQKIRSVGAILAQRRATCLDLVGLYCALAEAVGLHPVVIHVPEHALAGVLLADGQLSDVAVTDPAMIHNLGRSGRLLPVEVTAAVEGVKAPFEEAVRRGQTWFRESPSDAGPGLRDVIHVLDVASAHRRVRPLPRLRTATNGSTIVEIERESFLQAASSTETTETTTSTNEPDGPSRPPRIERWRSSLLDLSLRNPLLKLRATSGVVLAMDEQGLERLEDALHLGRRFELKSAADIGEIGHARGHRSAMSLDPQERNRIMRDERIVYVDTPLGQHASRLDRLRRTARLTIEETGANNLFLTLGALRWQDPQGGAALAPLFLLPMTLEGNRKTTYRMSLAEGAEPLPNYCLIEKLRRDVGLVIPALEHPPSDDAGIDVARVFRDVRNALIDRRLHYTVEPHARLALLQFATLEMWRDVSEHWPQLMNSPVVRHLVETPLQSFVDEVTAPEVTAVDEATACLPIPVDGSQLTAIRWATAGRTFILEGPPGTGKSQTITNMIADCVAAGRSVLFVAEKQAALEVVRRRLDASGLGRLTLDLHGRETSVRRVREQILQSWQIDHSVSGSRSASESDVLTSLVRTLDSYASAVHLPGDTGLSAWAAEGQICALRNEHPEDAFDNLTYDVPAAVSQSEESVRDALASLGRLAGALETLRRTADHESWSLVGPDANPAPESVVVAADELRVAVDALDPVVAAVLGGCVTQSWDALADWVERVECGNAIRPADLAMCSGPAFDARQRRVQSCIQQHEARFAALRGIMTPATENIRIDQVRDAIAEAARRSVFTRRKAREQVTAEVASRCLGPDAVSWETLPRFLDDLEQYRVDAARLTSMAWALVPDDSRLSEQGELRSIHDGILTMVENTRQIVREVADAEALDQVWIAARQRSGGTVPEQIRVLANAWREIRRLFDVQAAAEQRWRGDVPLLDRLRECLPSWSAAAARGRLTELQRTRSAASDVVSLQSLGLGPVIDDALVEAMTGDLAQARLRFRVAQERLAERLATTDLETTDGAGRDATVARYMAVAAAVRRGMTDEVIGRARRSAGFDRTRPMPEQAALLKWARMARGGSIRQGIAQHGRALQQVTPCFMMSPCSVARYLPIDALKFDIVIFDEASQIKVADAIGSLGRSRSAVIVGDSKQMPPTSMFDVGVAEEDEADEFDEVITPADQESILSEAVTSNLERLALTWHYRSRDETLIAFSNAEYYEGKLSSFPGPPIPSAGQGISVRHVDGVFQRGSRGATRVNREEAEAVVADITRRLAADPHSSIGVVTFNVQQRDLIADLLDESPYRSIRDALNRESEPIFVKNLENVQGDERDVVLFSLAFSPDPQTGRMSLNFGPLTRHGGERRLNVAITRARSEIVLFTSFRPHDIDLGRTSSVGMRHLRKYLTFAEEFTDESRTPGSTTSIDPYRASIARALAATGLDVREDIGLSSFRVDLAIRRPGGRWVAVVLDGPAWANRLIVADRDAIPAQALTTMGWAATMHVLLPDWVRDQTAVVHRLIAVAETVAADTVAADTEPAALRLVPTNPDADPASGARDVGVLTARTSAPERITSAAAAAPHDKATGAAFAEQCPRQEPFRGAARTAVVDRRCLDYWYEPTGAVMLRTQILSVLEAEAPIGSRRLAQIVGNRCGLQRLSAERESDILGCVPADVVREDLGNLGVWYWSTGCQPDSYDVFRTGSVSERPIQEVPPMEVLNAMRFVLRLAGPLPRDELLRQANRALGAARFGGSIREHLDQALDWALGRERLTADGHLVTERGSPPVLANR